MRPTLLLISVFFTAVLLLSATDMAFASQPNQGYVQYSVSFTGQTGTKTFTVNESASGTSQSGFVDLGLAISSSNTNLSFSRVLNTSSLPETFPYLSGLNNETFSFQSHGTTISASIHDIGTSSVTFNGRSYQLTNYEIVVSATNSSSGKSVSLNGTVSSVPSGLLYSAELRLNDTYTASVQLLSTNLPLVDPASSNSSTTIGAAIVGAGVFGAFVLAFPTIFKKTRNTSNIQKNAPEEKETNKKPDYWVD